MDREPKNRSSWTGARFFHVTIATKSVPAVHGALQQVVKLCRHYFLQHSRCPTGHPRPTRSQFATSGDQKENGAEPAPFSRRQKRLFLRPAVPAAAAVMTAALA